MDQVILPAGKNCTLELLESLKSMRTSKKTLLHVLGPNATSHMSLEVQVKIIPRKSQLSHILLFYSTVLKSSAKHDFLPCTATKSCSPGIMERSRTYSIICQASKELPSQCTSTTTLWGMSPQQHCQVHLGQFGRKLLCYISMAFNSHHFEELGSYNCSFLKLPEVWIKSK